MPFIVTLSVGFMAALFAISVVDTEDQSRFALILPTVALFTLAYFLHKASLSWIRISEDGTEVVSVPSWYSRRLWGEHRVVGRIISGSELLFCRRSAYGAFDGYYVVLRTPGMADLVLWNAESGISRRVWQRAADDIRERYRLNVRVIKQIVSDQGKQETDWTAESDRTLWRNLRLVIGPAVFPWLGIGVALLTADPLKITLVGVLLWLAGISLFRYFYRGQQIAIGQSLGALTFVWTIQFVALYALTALITRAIFHR
jgi:hypothetical protein